MKHRLAVSACCSSAIVAAVGLTAAGTAQPSAAGAAAAPQKGAQYEGKATGGAAQPDPLGQGKSLVKLKVSRSGKRVDVRGPHGCPGFNPFPRYFGQIKKLAVSEEGRFKGKRKYTDDSNSNYVLNWSVEVSGRFVSSKQAKGTISYEMKQSGRSGPTPQSCGKKSGQWSAKRVKSG